jgi:hypothetical protein
MCPGRAFVDETRSLVAMLQERHLLRQREAERRNKRRVPVHGREKEERDGFESETEYQKR